MEPQIGRFHGKFDPPVTEGERSVLTGSAPAAAMGGYQRESPSCALPLQPLSKWAYSPTLSHSTTNPAPWAQNTDLLLEPVLSFSLEIPTGLLGRAMSDVQRFRGRFIGILLYYLVRIMAGLIPLQGRAEPPLPPGVGRHLSLVSPHGCRRGKQDYEPYRYHRQSRGNENNPGQERQGKNGPAGAGEYGGAGPGRKREEYLLVDGYNIISCPGLFSFPLLCRWYL